MKMENIQIKNIKEYLFTCIYLQDVNKYIKLLDENGANYCATLKIPFYNIWGQPISTQYLIIYQHTEEINMEKLT